MLVKMTNVSPVEFVSQIHFPVVLGLLEFVPGGGEVLENDPLRRLVVTLAQGSLFGQDLEKELVQAVPFFVSSEFKQKQQY